MKTNTIAFVPIIIMAAFVLLFAGNVVLDARLVAHEADDNELRYWLSAQRRDLQAETETPTEVIAGCGCGGR